MESDLSRFIKVPNLDDLKAKKIPRKVILLVILSAFIGFLISPKIIFRPKIYEEGDIINQTINIDEDLLIPDKVSTQLKREQLSKELRPIYDFDPGILEKTKRRIGEVFQTNRLLFDQLKQQTRDIENRNRTIGKNYFNAVVNLRSVVEQILFYKRYGQYLKQQLKTHKGNLKLKNFIKKQKLDTDLSIVNQLLKSLEDKKAYFQREKATFSERLKSVEKENENLLKTIEDRKKNAILGFDKSMNIEFSEEERQLLDVSFFSQDIENKLSMVLTELLTKKIVISKDVFLAQGNEKIEVRNLKSGETQSIDNLSEFYSVQEARNQVSGIVKDLLPENENSKEASLIIVLSQKLTRPTVSENKQEYEKRQNELVANMSPVFFSVKKGEIIARAGDRVTKLQVDLINSYYEAVSNIDKLPRMVGVFLFVLFALTLVSFTFLFPGAKVVLSFRELILIISSVLIALILVKGGVQLGEILESRYLDSHSGVFRYMLPVTLGSMLVGILLNFHAAIMAGLLTSLFSSIMMQGNLYYFFYAMMGSIAVSLPMAKFDSRYSLLLHGLKVSAINLPMVFVIFLIESNQIGTIIWLDVGAAVFAGVLTAMFTSILLPFFESIFDITTNLKLLELSNMNHPVLKKLIFNAPGTYQHSIIVGNLAESAATKIGANPLLSRVSSYYHDIGKAFDSLYFIENQSPNYPNVHDNLNPRRSARIIIDHLKKGAEMADKGRLGKDIKNILLQHHGTGLVKYFFNKEKENKRKSGVEEQVDDRDFRYPGPKPQSLEAALVMLADVAEASTRSLNRPTTESVREIVKKVCWSALEDGQLDQSGLTLHTFHTIVDVYCSMLISIHHHRIEYPESDEKTER